MYIPRFLEKYAFSDKFGRQMRFIAGPRQSGKTTTARQILSEKKSERFYYNWDRLEIRKRYRSEGDFIKIDLSGQGKKPIWSCFDEIHKYPKWKNILKDFFDSYEERIRFIITGSARLDLFRHSGDSLAGRYFLFRLYPLILAETCNRTVEDIIFEDDTNQFIEKCINKKPGYQDALSGLLNYSGFPETFLKTDALFHKKWQEAYQERIIREDLREISHIHQLEKVMELLLLLPERVGSPLSINALREDLEINFRTVENYLKYLDLIYLTFTVLPFGSKIKNIVKKEKKIYFFDWTTVKQLPVRFENYVAVELLSRIEMSNNLSLNHFELYFVRTKNGKETDFLITKNKEPWLLVEVKLNKTKIQSHHFLHSRLLGEIPLVQVVMEDNVLQSAGNSIQVSANRFF